MIKRLKIMLLGLCVFGSILTLLLRPTAQLAAQNASPSADAILSQSATDSAASNEPGITENIRNRIQQAVENSGGNNASQLAVVGLLESITDQSIDILVEDTTEFVSIDDDVLIIDDTANEVDLEDVALNSGVIVIGQRDSTDIIQANTIVSVGELPELEPIEVIKGSIVAVEDLTSTTSQIELYIEPEMTSQIYTVDSDSVLYDGFSETNQLELSELAPNREVVVFVERDQEEDADKLVKQLHTTYASPSAETSATQSN